MGFLGIGAMEALVIIVAALIIFGPGRLPEVMGQAGRTLRDLRRASQELTGDFRESIDEVRQTYEEVESDMRNTAQELRRESNQIAKEVNSAVSDATRTERAQKRRARPATSGQKLDQLDVNLDDVSDADDLADALEAAKPQAAAGSKRASTPKQKPKATAPVGDDLLAVDDSEEDLLSLNGAHGDAKDEPVTSD